MKETVMGAFLAKIIDDNGEEAATRIMTSDRPDAARTMVRSVLEGYDDGLYTGLVKVWNDGDKDDPGTVYGWEALRKSPEGFDEENEVLDVNVKLTEQS
jgi:hypothetical protein